MVDKRAYRRLLRWYPRAWRERHGEALLGVMLDEAEDMGRARPLSAERRAAAIHGLGSRLTAGLSAWCGVLAAVLSSLSLAMMLWSPVFHGAVDAVVYAATWAVSLALVSVGVLGLIRQAGRLSPPRALVVACLATTAWAIGAIAGMAWSVGFEAADANLPQPAFAALFVPFALAAWVLGAVTVAIVVDGLRAGRASSRVLRAVVAGGVGVVVTPVLGAQLVAPIAPLAAAVVLVVAAIQCRRRW